jgi:hypothetical protein
MQQQQPDPKAIPSDEALDAMSVAQVRALADTFNVNKRITRKETLCANLGKIRDQAALESRSIAKAKTVEELELELAKARSELEEAKRPSNEAKEKVEKKTRRRKNGVQQKQRAVKTKASAQEMIDSWLNEKSNGENDHEESDSSNSSDEGGEEATTQRCLACQARNPSKAKFCGGCGSGLGSASQVTCPTCNTKQAARQRCCHECGQQLQVDKSNPQEAKIPNLKGKGVSAKESVVAAVRDGKAVDLGLLLPYSVPLQEEELAVGGGLKLTLVKDALKKTKITTGLSWARAFVKLLTIVRTLEMPKETVANWEAHFDNVLMYGEMYGWPVAQFYDESLRGARALDASHDFGWDNNLWEHAKVNKLGRLESSASHLRPQQPSKHNGSFKRPEEPRVCFLFNKPSGCTRTPCPFEHICQKCSKAGHPVSKCKANE